jgi:L-threonylcarbamoyladenylate synthase
MAADEAGIAEAARLILAGQPVAVPTETVYGLAADATSGEAVARIYAAKGRPSFNPLIVHVPGVEEAERIALLDERARELAERYWPGPLTMVLKVRPDAPIASLVTAGLDTVAIRAAAHPRCARSSRRPAARSLPLPPMPAAASAPPAPSTSWPACAAASRSSSTPAPPPTAWNRPSSR